MKIISAFAGIMFVAGVISCGNKSTPVNKDPEKKDTTIVEKNQPQQNNDNQEPKFVGTLPCSDCEAVETELQFSNGGTGCGVFLTHKNGDLIITKHNMSNEKGFEKDADATVYILEGNKKQPEKRYFVCESGKEDVLLELDKNKKRFTDGKNHALKKKVE